METSDHSKNGATPKSLTSREIINLMLWQNQQQDLQMVQVQQESLLVVDGVITLLLLSPKESKRTVLGLSSDCLAGQSDNKPAHNSGLAQAGKTCFV